jgi:predicted DCC family thiol-disulfide oxidoreductase YuxK
MNQYIILFDGICNFCNYWVNIILRLDKKKKFLFTPLQSQTGQKYLSKFGFNLTEFHTFILIDGNKFLIKSDAALFIIKQLPFPLKFLYIFNILPRKFRDWIYSLIANNRYKIFGKSEICRIPSAEEKNRFLT